VCVSAAAAAGGAGIWTASFAAVNFMISLRCFSFIRKPSPPTVCLLHSIFQDNRLSNSLEFAASLSYSMLLYTAIKYPVPDWVKPSFVIFDIRAL